MGYRNAGLWALLALCSLGVGAGRAQVVIVDNADVGFSVLAESWTTVSATGQYGADYRYRLTGAPFGGVEWRPNLPKIGRAHV